MKRVDHLEAHGEDRIEALTFGRTAGKRIRAEADTLLIHEGIVPKIRPVIASGCALEWDEAQFCFRPCVGEWGQIDKANILYPGSSCQSWAEHR